MTEETYLPTKKVAEILHVDPVTIGNWIRNGELKAMKKNPLRRNSPYLVPQSEVDRFLKLQEQGEG